MYRCSNILAAHFTMNPVSGTSKLQKYCNIDVEAFFNEPAGFLELEPNPCMLISPLNIFIPSYHCDGLQLSGRIITNTELKRVTLQNAIIKSVNTRNST